MSSCAECFWFAEAVMDGPMWCAHAQFHGELASLEPRCDWVGFRERESNQTRISGAPVNQYLFEEP